MSAQFLPYRPALSLRGASRRAVLASLLLACAGPVCALQLDIAGPAGSVAFGKSVKVLPNGNIVVLDPDALGTMGAAYLYSPVGVLISTLTGSSADDQIGSHGVSVLSNGNYVIRSRNWDGGAVNVGAVTWGSATTGVSGVVSASNSLVGSSANDGVGEVPLVVLSNGNYVIISPFWNNGGISDAGAVTWGNGASGSIGVVSSANSLVGTAASDQVGTSVTALSNGHYVVASTSWNNGATADVGAATWCDGDTGRSGTISVSNSLIGSTASDRVGNCGVTALSNGNYVVNSAFWNGFRGAATWGNGASGSFGAINSGNSLVGATANDQVGAFGNCLPTAALSNGNYVISTPGWNN
ncbi:MAG TPA: hypothetical protein VN259_09995, partial [Xanthomonadales bacterium]|nr:hypothetical protein [Xanthomonadales bacterium]